MNKFDTVLQTFLDNLIFTGSTYYFLVTYLSGLQVLLASLGGLVPLYAVFTTSWGYEYLIKQGQFFFPFTRTVCTGGADFDHF